MCVHVFIIITMVLTSWVNYVLLDRQTCTTSISVSCKAMAEKISHTEKKWTCNLTTHCFTCYICFITAGNNFQETPISYWKFHLSIIAAVILIHKFLKCYYNSYVLNIMKYISNKTKTTTANPYQLDPWDLKPRQFFLDFFTGAVQSDLKYILYTT